MLVLRVFMLHSYFLFCSCGLLYKSHCEMVILNFCHCQDFALDCRVVIMDNFELHSWCDGGLLTKDVAMIFFTLSSFVWDSKTKQVGMSLKSEFNFFSFFSQWP